MEYEGDEDSNFSLCDRNNHKRLDQGTQKIRKWKTSGVHLEYNIIKIGQNTEKSPGNLGRLAVSCERPLTNAHE